MTTQANPTQLPHRLPLLVHPENRASSADIDARLINGFLERSAGGDYSLYSRPGLGAPTRPPGANAAGSGVFHWQGSVYSVFGTTLYKGTTSIGTVNGAGGVYRFISSGGSSPRLVLGNGVEAYTWNDVALSTITDPDFKKPFYKGWAYLDKTLYYMSSPNQIWGSDLDDPTSWDPLNVINAHISPSTGIGVDRHLVYVVAFKQWDTEIFYNAANATGSPLSPVQGARLNYGCLNINTVQNIDGALFWVCTTQNSSPQVIMLDNLKPTIISTPAIDRLLDKPESTYYSWTLKEAGHLFYGLTLKDNNITLVFDVKEGLWAQWTDTNGNYFPIVASSYNADGRHVFQHETNGRLYVADSIYVTDDGELITTDIYTPNFDAGVARGKQLNYMWFLGDRTPGSVLQVRHNDHDYKADRWSSFRSVDMDTEKPFLDRCGTFKRRAFHIRHRANARLRIRAIDLQMDLCVL